MIAPEDKLELHASQRAAIEHVTRQARARNELARTTLAEVCAMSNIAHAELEHARANIREHARIALHFHPDRPDAEHRSVAQNLLAQGIYKSQFETRMSNGSVTAFPGGARDSWERKLFGGAYHGEDVLDAHRPKYGALDLMRHADGASPRFGSCYFVLAQHVSARATFTYLDSHQDPTQTGTLEQLDDVLAALLLESFTRDFAVGEKNIRPAQLVAHLCERLPAPYEDPAGAAPTRNLDHYVEAQVHGPVRLRQDVELLVADPSFRGTHTGQMLLELAERYAIRLAWHRGFWLAPHEVLGDFRGPGMPQLAARVARAGRVDAAAIGEAAMALHRTPEDWPYIAGVAPLQQLKLLWHVLVRYGHAAD
jgi:hypothetical protein